MKESKAYVTLLGSQNYLLGLLALYESWLKTKSSYPFYAILSSEIDKRTENYIQDIGINIIREDIEISIPENVLEANKNFSVERWSNTLLKLKVFDLTQFTKIVFLDSDMMVLRNLDHLFEFPHMTATNSGALYPGNEDWKELNSGLMVIVPEAGLYEKIFSMFNRVASRKVHFGDQDLINEYYSDWYSRKELYLQEVYNVFSNYLSYYLTNLGLQYKGNDNSSVAVIHFIGYPKPWMYKDNLLLYLYRSLKYFLFGITGLRKADYLKLKYKMMITKCKHDINKLNLKSI